MSGDEDHGESHEKRWSWRNNTMVAHTSSSNMTGGKDDHDGGV